MRNETEKEKEKKEAVSLWLSEEVIEALDKKSDDLDRSRSWIANDSLKRDLGLIGIEEEGER